MVDEKIYVGDIGTVFRINCNTDISDATLVQILIQKPDDETQEEWTGSVVDSNYIEYTTVDGDIDQVGNYYGMVYIETPAGKWHGEMFNFMVFDLFE